MRTRDVRCVLHEFEDHVYNEEHPNVHVTEWINAEGVDVHFSTGEKVSMSWSQWEALKEVIDNKFLEPDENTNSEVSSEGRNSRVSERERFWSRPAGH